MKNLATAALAAAALWAAGPAAAQEQMISAKDPQGMMRALEAGGYAPKLDTDSSGDPRIEIELSGYRTFILFYGCDEATHAGCDSIQLSAGFDRKKPWNAKDAIMLAREYRFAAVSLDDDGDPYVTWDILTGEGLPARLFFASLLRFADSIDTVSERAFAGE